MKVFAAGNGQMLLKNGDKYCSDTPKGVFCKTETVGPREKFTVGCISGCSNTEFGTCNLVEPNCDGSLETQTDGQKTDNELNKVCTTLIRVRVREVRVGAWVGVWVVQT